MLQPIYDQIKLIIDTTLTHYAGRVVILIPLLVAGGFGTAVVYMLLADALGPVNAAAILTGVFVIVTLLVAMIVTLQERNQRTALHYANQQSALASSLLAAAPVALAGGGQLARLLMTRTPLLLGGALLAALVVGRVSESSKLTGNANVSRPAAPLAP